MRQNFKFIIVIIMCGSLFGSLSFAKINVNLAKIEAGFSNEVTLSSLLDYAYHTNPSIQASKESWKIFIENYRIGKGYPDPQLMVTYFPSPIETRLGPQDWNLNFSQPIPFPGKLTQRGKVLEADTRISKLKVDKTVRNIVTSLSSSYYELVYIQRAIEIAKANFDLNQELVKISENKFSQEKGSIYDISKAQAQTAQIQYDILLLEELEQTEKAKINTILDRDPNAFLGIARNIQFRNVFYSLNEIYDFSMEHQEDVLIAEEKIGKADDSIKLSKYDSLPLFKLGLFYAGIGDPDVPSPPKDAGDDAIGIQFGLTIPIWFGKNKSKVSKALASKRKAQAEKRQIANKNKENISRLWFKLQNSKRLITLYEGNLLPQSLNSLQTAETWYREGQGSFADFLEIQATTYNFQLSLARARADYGKTLVKLEQLAGVVLDRKTESVHGGDKS